MYVGTQSGGIRRAIGLLSAVSLLLVGCAATARTPSIASDTTKGIPTLIALRDPASDPTIAKTIAALSSIANVTVRFLRRTSGRESVFLLFPSSRAEYVAALEKLRGAAIVEFAEEDERMSPQSTTPR